MEKVAVGLQLPRLESPDASGVETTVQVQEIGSRSGSVDAAAESASVPPALETRSGPAFATGAWLTTVTDTSSDEEREPSPTVSRTTKVPKVSGVSAAVAVPAFASAAVRPFGTETRVHAYVRRSPSGSALASPEIDSETPRLPCRS